MGERHIQQSSYSMEWCRWINVTFNNLVIPWNGVDGVEYDVNPFTPFHGITRLSNVTFTHLHHSME
jgi:hypothetical protein